MFGMWADGPHDIKNAHHYLICILFIFLGQKEKKKFIMLLKRNYQ